MKLKAWEKFGCIIVGVLMVMSIIVYVCNFEFRLSTLSSDWGNFGAYLSGTIITLLTVVNIWLFYRLTLIVEDKNSERAIKNKVYETQGVISQMRMKFYEDIRPLINDIKLELYAIDNCPYTKLLELKKRLLEIDSSLLFTTGINTESFMRLQTVEVLNLITTLEDPHVKHIDTDPIINALNSYLYQMEYYIVMQSIKDGDVSRYVTRHSEDMDSTIKCMMVMFQEMSNLNQRENI